MLHSRQRKERTASSGGASSGGASSGERVERRSVERRSVSVERRDRRGGAKQQQRQSTKNWRSIKSERSSSRGDRQRIGGASSCEAAAADRQKSSKERRSSGAAEVMCNVVSFLHEFFETFLLEATDLRRQRPKRRGYLCASGCRRNTRR